jgi:metallophosphoesterase superfamily enzyme
MTTTAHPHPQTAISSAHAASVPETAYLTRRGGRVAYDVAGDGPLLVLLPGMGRAHA